MNRRSGSSLVEVLVAIFVMGLGLIALLTLFPIGMLRMAQAIRDAKCAQAAQNAHTLSVVNKLSLDSAVLIEGVIPDLFANTYPPDPPNGVLGLKNADPFGESYALLVDPIAYSSPPTASQRDWVGSVPGLLRRRQVSYAPTPLARYKAFTLLDDIKFENTFDPATRPTTPGTPYKLTAATNMFRDPRYSWAYLLRRPQTSDPSIVDCAIVVFEARDLLSLPEHVYSTSYYDPLRNAITIDYTNNVPPPIRPGNWLLDATVIQSATVGTQHAYFYKVVSTEEFVIPGPKTLVRYEVATPLRGASSMPLVPDPLNPTGQAVFQGTTIVLDGVAEVYEKGPARLP